MLSSQRHMLGADLRAQIDVLSEEFVLLGRGFGSRDQRVPPA